MSEVLIHKATPNPVAWEVECPVCGSQVEVSMKERDCGAIYESSDDYGDPFVTCACDATIEPEPISVVPSKSGGA